MNSFGNPHSHLVDGIRRMYNERQYTDVTIKVANHTFQCHSLVLSSVSAYFEAMFTSGMKESREMSVTLHDIDPDTFKDVLLFIYNGKDIVTSNNVGDLLQISTMLQLVCLTEKCEGFMIKNIDSENCLNIWKLAKLHNCMNLKEVSELHILNSFDDVIDNNDLMLLEFDEITFLLKHENLRADTEEAVCTAVLNWVEFDKGAREEKFFSLFRYIRLTSLNLEYILDTLDQHPLILNNKECFKLVRNAIKYHALPARRQDWSSLDEIHRLTDDYERALTVIGCRTLSNGSKVNEFIGYSFQRKRWMDLPNMPSNIGEDFAVCSYGDDVFVSGGTEDLSSCIQFSAKFSRWRKRESLNVGRYRHCMVAVRGSLYVLGGYNFGTLGSIEEYDIHSELWKQVGELHYAVDAASAAAVGNKIYIFGGWLGAEGTAAIQCFDTMSYTCTKVSFFPKPCKFSKAIVEEGQIRVMCSSGELFAFSEKNGCKIVGFVPHFSQRNFGFLSLNNECMIVGGEKNIFSGEVEYSICSDVIRIGEKKIDKEEALQLPVPMEVFGCIKTKIFKRFPLADFSSDRMFETD